MKEFLVILKNISRQIRSWQNTVQGVAAAAAEHVLLGSYVVYDHYSAAVSFRINSSQLIHFELH